MPVLVLLLATCLAVAASLFGLAARQMFGIDRDDVLLAIAIAGAAVQVGALIGCYIYVIKQREL